MPSVKPGHATAPASLPGAAGLLLVLLLAAGLGWGAYAAGQSAAGAAEAQQVLTALIKPACSNRSIGSIPTKPYSRPPAAGWAWPSRAAWRA